MPKRKFILKNSSSNAGCVFAYFCGGHKNNFRLQFRSSFKSEKRLGSVLQSFLVTVDILLLIRYSFLYIFSTS